MSDTQADKAQQVKGLILKVLAAIVGFPVFIYLVLNLFTGGLSVDPSNPDMKPALIEARIAPIGISKVAEPGAAPAAVATAAASTTVAAADTKADPATKGKEIYNTVCVACHGSGVLNAPKFGDKAAWAPRLKGGVEEAIQIAIKGLNSMPPKGGYTGSDAEFHAAAEYLIGAAK